PTRRAESKSEEVRGSPSRWIATVLSAGIFLMPLVSAGPMAARGPSGRARRATRVNRPVGAAAPRGYPTHSKNSSAVSTGFSHRAAFFAFDDWDPASATTSTSVLVLVRFGTAT